MRPHPHDNRGAAGRQDKIESTAGACLKRKYAILFLMILTINYIVWVKVSSDIFLIFSLFLCIPSESDEGTEQNVIEK